MRKYWIILLLLIISNTSFSQKNKFIDIHNIDVSMNIPRLMLLEPNVEAAFMLNKHFGLYCLGGYDTHFYKQGSEVSSFYSTDNLSLSYHGPIFLYGIYKEYYHHSKKGKPYTSYIKVGITNKYLSYSNIMTGSTYRDEQARVFGIHLLMGFKTSFFKSKRLYLDWYSGIGYRKKIRNYISYNYSWQNKHHEDYRYPVFFAGISIGYHLKKSSEKTPDNS